MFFRSQIENLRGRRFWMKIWIIFQKMHNFFNLHPFEVWFDAKFVELLGKILGILKIYNFHKIWGVSGDFEDFLFLFFGQNFFLGARTGSPPPRKIFKFFSTFKDHV